jgi:ceramide glucosyltransferase
LSNLIIFVTFVVAFGLHIVSITLMLIRLTTRRCSHFVGTNTPPVSIVRPVSGLENFIEATLASSFDLNHPNYEVIFCVDSATDPAVSIVRRLIMKHAHVRARLLIGNERISANPKLNNCFKGWNTAANEWIVLADSNVLMPDDYLLRLLDSWETDTGLVCSPPVGSHPQGFWARVECAFLNGYQAHWQYTADTIGFGFAQGKNMFCRREVLDVAGGFSLLAQEPGEDAAFTKIIRAAGLRVRLVAPPFAQPLGYRTAMEVWQRQVRWARIRRASFPFVFALEILTGLILPLVSGLCFAARAELPLVLSAAVLVAIWYGAEMLLARVAGWPLSLAYPVYAATRDLMLPVLWLAGWRERGFNWRGHTISIDERERTEAAEARLP